MQASFHYRACDLIIQVLGLLEELVGEDDWICLSEAFLTQLKQKHEESKS